MDKYETLGLVGEGSYGMVMKCRNKETGRIVAVKKFLETEDDKTVKKIALREIKMLKQLRHENLINLIEVCRKKKRLYLVFEFVERTVLDDLEQHPNGLDYNRVRKYLFQILRAIAFCHLHNIIHRDIKPENILVSQHGVVKVCDFGFARMMAAPGEVYTDYVATRWYRAPELLVGDTKYGKAVDVWAIGCLLMEMLTGEPLFPGESDIDQLHHIMRCFGDLTPKHQELFYRNPVFAGVGLPEVKGKLPLEMRIPNLSAVVSDLTKKCLQIDPEQRPLCADLLQHTFFNHDGFSARFIQELNAKIQKESKENPLPKMSNKIKRNNEDYSTLEKATPFIDLNTNAKGKAGKWNVQVSKDNESGGLCVPAKRQSDKTKLMDHDKTQESLIVLSRAPTLKDVNLDHPKPSTASVIPPITHSLLVVTNTGLNMGTRVPLGPLGGRSIDKMKKQGNSFIKISQQFMPNNYNGNISGQIVSEKGMTHERSFQPGNILKKKGENHRADIHLPELKSTVLPELPSPEAKQSKLNKKELKKKCRIPSITAMDVRSSESM